ncbi:B1 bradykinin receptor [Poeciliopsis prolifica]|uniref:B1 bradykinin receptor n=1 Tax=Poeciliopsis prolifica TaxID=188132 RepID=UPI0024137645|nr:B1 bradykinin receptor [Poeciliopsis prolifica]XP_054909344.1 B1 bradykinin receptor [Poeciliopsis prolifica]XP_054909345.1 B1 bradykinin receptor [Poeciliopsis prolifica]XP_054909346.1 B1 bradykinin receptor [Poeciliopsis prolifica]
MDAPDPTYWHKIHILVPPYIFIVSLFGLLLNGFVLAVFAAHKDRLTVAEIYLCNLVLADFLLLCGLPFWAMYILNYFNWSYGEGLCKLVNSIVVLNFYTSIYTLVMISIDRYLALMKTTMARWLRRTRFAKIACFILWLFGLLLSLPSIVHRKVKFIEEYNTTSCILDYTHGRSWKIAHQIMLNILGFVLPLVLILLSSWNIIKALAHKTENLAFHDFNDTKSTVLVYTVILLFLLCWGPFQIFTFLDMLCDMDTKMCSSSLSLGNQVSVYLAFLNSLLNPLLYVFSGQYFRMKVVTMFKMLRDQYRRSCTTTHQQPLVSTLDNRTEPVQQVVISNANDQAGLE